MRYVSLLKTMSAYGYAIADHRDHREIGHRIMGMGLDQRGNNAMFTIETTAPDEQGQLTKMLRFRDIADADHLFSQPISPFITVPPIVEIEWMRENLELEETQMNVLEHMAYLFVMHVLEWFTRFESMESGYYVSLLEQKGSIIDVEELEDTPRILSTMLCPSQKLPKISYYDVHYMYGANFPELFRSCKEKSRLDRVYYFNLPMLLTAFVVDFYGTNLNQWLKATRLSIEEELKACLATLDSLAHRMRSVHNVDTYGRGYELSDRDMALLTAVFRTICNTLHERNVNIGLISYSEYKGITGPDTTHASVRLAGMNINWNTEIKRANDEKASKESE